MKVKSKLYLNMVVTVIGIGLIAGASLVGILFVQGKLSLLTERSTPYQLKTLELQRTLQEHISNLLKVASSNSLNELNAARGETEKSLGAARKVAGELAAIKGGAGSGDSLTELDTVTQEMVKTTEARIRAEDGAKSAGGQMKAKLQGIAQKLRSLDSSVKKVQKGSMRQLNASNEGVRNITRRVKNVQATMNAINDVKIALLEISSAESKGNMSVARSHFTVASRWVTQGELAKSEKDSGAVKELTDGIGEITKKVTGPQGLIELKNSLIAKPDDETRKKFSETHAQVMQKLSQLTVIMGDLVEKAAETYAAENKKFDESLQGSETAGGKLSANSELVALGADINITAKEMFGVRTVKELESFRDEINQRFASASAIEKQLAGKGKGEEARTVAQVSSALGDIKAVLFAKDGAYDKLLLKLRTEQQAEALNQKLKAVVAKQHEEGLKGVSSAQNEQEKAVKSVNSMVRTFVFTVAIIGGAVLLFGIVFSRLIANSITRPIQDLKVLAEGFGNGDFSRKMDEARKDEFGELAANFNQATVKLGEITGKLSSAIVHLASQSRQLSGTAEELNRGAREQASRTEQSATAMTEMSHTITEVAGNAITAADAAKEALATAAQGEEVVGQTVTGMEKIAASVREAATLIGQLGASSERIGAIIDVINDIADQTNLLALNAAIEAARAGEQGRGFAVVADEVRKLAQRTTEATGEIAGMIKDIQGGTARSVAAMDAGNENVENGVALAGRARESLTAIVESSGRGAEMVERIATASEEQSATAHEVNANMEGIAGITRETMRSMEEITASADELARIADELTGMAQWFKMSSSSGA